MNRTHTTKEDWAHSYREWYSDSTVISEGCIRCAHSNGTNSNMARRKTLAAEKKNFESQGAVSKNDDEGTHRKTIPRIPKSRY
jgi:hypothetical protein